MTSSARRTVAAWVAALIGIGIVVGARLALRDGPLDRLAREERADGRTSYRGSWHFPRGGPYVLGFESPNGPAILSVDGAVVAKGRGQVHARLVFPPKIVAVELVAPPGARLLWHPPGRRGPLEYVLPSSLSELAPDAARFGPFAGADPVGGAVALLALLLVLAAVAFTMRGELARTPRKVWIALLVVFSLALVVRLWDLGSAGATWDEDVNWSAGRNYVINLLELDFARDSWQWNFEHPPLTKYIAGIGALFADGYGPARALSAIVVALACAFAAAIARRLFGLQAAVLAGISLALSPHLIAHGKVVGHEATAALWWSVAVWASLRIADCDPEDRWTLARRIALVGVVTGMAVFSRFANALLGPLVWLLIALYAPRGRRVWAAIVAAVAIPVIIVIVGYALWPRLWAHPVDGLVESWDKLRRPHGAEFFLGSYDNSPPVHYFPTYLMATAPVALLALAWLWALSAALRRRRAQWVPLLWLAIPLAIALSPVRQDGVRYIMPSVMALAVMAGLGADVVARALARYHRRAGAIVALLLVAYLGAAALRIHPYYLDYYGEQVGGPEGVYERRALELAWWGEGLDRAVGYINGNAAQGAAVYKACVIPSHLAWLRHDLWAAEARRPDRADWILVYQPYTRSCRVPADARLVYQVTAMGAPLAQVFRREAGR